MNTPFTTPFKKYIWRTFIELCADTGVDITDYLFKRPPLKRMNFKFIIEEIINMRNALDYDESEEWQELLEKLE